MLFTIRNLKLIQDEKIYNKLPKISKIAHTGTQYIKQIKPSQE